MEEGFGLRGLRDDLTYFLVIYFVAIRIKYNTMETGVLITRVYIL